MTTESLTVRLSRRLAECVERQKEFLDNESALKYMNECIQLILKELRAFTDCADIYRLERDKKNIHLFEIMDDVVVQLNTMFSDSTNIMVKPMSSICARLNLINESDIDIGLLVTNLDQSDGTIDPFTYANISAMLESHGFLFDHSFNKDVPSNRYFSFIKFIDGAEVEVKVRDHEKSNVVLELHEYLDTRLTNEQITLYTYGKYLFKQLDKTDDSHRSYGKFKKMIYESAFSHIKGGFVLKL
jgi:hypothetical protein